VNVHAFWAAIALLLGLLGAVTGISSGSKMGAESAEARIAETCRQSGAFVVKRSAFSCARAEK